jgi:uncharacterized membrane protein YtjA (UPF0391 family)
VFFVIALIAAALGNRGVAGLSARIGYVFVAIALVFLAVALLNGSGPAATPVAASLGRVKTLNLGIRRIGGGATGDCHGHGQARAESASGDPPRKSVYRCRRIPK